MNTRPKNRPQVAWLALTLITLGYLAMDDAVDRGGALQPSAVVTSAAIVIALLKVRIIFREFMEVRQAPTLLVRLTDIWVVVIGASLLATYFIGTAGASGR